MLNGHHDEGASSVTMDEAQGIAEAVADAAGKGVRTATLLTGRMMSLVEQARVASYRQALQRHGIKLLDELAGDYSYASGRALAQQIDVEGTGAVFCTSDAMAMGVLDAHRRHFPEHRPARFRLYGFDNVSLTQFDAYPISSIGADKKEYVAQIVRILNQPAELAQNSAHVLVATRFVPRLTG
jgi:DNA-binding LacI/PurR family transcriptional regulator